MQFTVGKHKLLKIKKNRWQILLLNFQDKFNCQIRNLTISSYRAFWPYLYLCYWETYKEIKNCSIPTNFIMYNQMVILFLCMFTLWIYSTNLYFLNRNSSWLWSRKIVLFLILKNLKYLGLPSKMGQTVELKSVLLIHRFFFSLC